MLQRIKEAKHSYFKEFPNVMFPNVMLSPLKLDTAYVSANNYSFPHPALTEQHAGSCRVVFVSSDECKSNVLSF